MRQFFPLFVSILFLFAGSFLPAADLSISGLDPKLKTYSGRLVKDALRCIETTYQFVSFPESFSQASYVTVLRGNPKAPGAAYSFTVDKPVTVYLSVLEKGKPTLEGWEKTSHKISWSVGREFTDLVYKKDFGAGTVQIPEHNGSSDDGTFGIPHAAIVIPK